MSARHRHVKKRIRALEDTRDDKRRLAGAYLAVAQDLMDRELHDAAERIHDACDTLISEIQSTIVELAEVERQLAAMPQRLDIAP